MVGQMLRVKRAQGYPKEECLALEQAGQLFRGGRHLLWVLDGKHEVRSLRELEWLASRDEFRDEPVLELVEIRLISGG